MKFNERLKELMNERDLTQTDIVKASNLTDSQVYYLCSGRSKNPTLLTLLELCEALHVGMNELLKDVDPPAPSKNKQSQSN